MKQIQGKQGLVRNIARFGKPRVREIGIPLYMFFLDTFMITFCRYLSPAKLLVVSYVSYVYVNKFVNVDVATDILS